MSHPALHVHTSAASVPDAIEAEPTPIPADELLTRLAAVEAPGGWLEFAGPRPAAHPVLPALLAAARARGLRTRLITDHPGLNADRLAELLASGLEIVRLRLHGPPEAHDALTGRSGDGQAAHEAAKLLAGTPACKLELLATVTTPALVGLPSLVALASTLHAELHLQPLPPTVPARLRTLRPTAAPLAAALAAARERADTLGVRLFASGFAGPPPPPRPTGSAPALGANLLTFLRDDVPQPDLVGGVSTADLPADRLDLAIEAAGGAQELGLQLAAWRCPPIDLPAQLGGPGRYDPQATLPSPWHDRVPAEHRGPLPVWTPAPGRRVAVISPPMTDKVMTLSTLPALVRALRARGAEVDFASVWGDAEGRAPVTSGPARRAQVAGADEAWRAVLADLDLSDRDLVLVPGFEAADEVLAHPTFPVGARLVIADFHLLAGIDRWKARWIQRGARSMDMGWWPGENLHVHSCFPSFARLYRLAGVPQRQILWRPYPFDLDRYPPGPPPSTCEAWFAGGNQQRDWAALAEASHLLREEPVHPIDLYTRHQPPTAPTGPLRYHGTVDLDVFYERLRTSRGCAVPVAWNRHAAAGLTVVAMALAAGRPVLSTLTPGTLDHLRHGEDALLVPAGDPRALARAFKRLDGDGALLDVLSAGARRAAQVLSVSRWADDLLDGAPPVRAHGRPGGPWTSWA
jgi:hypothetical protein